MVKKVNVRERMGEALRLRSEKKSTINFYIREWSVYGTQFYDLYM
jgi:hypothetical protein